MFKKIRVIIDVLEEEKIKFAVRRAEPLEKEEKFQKLHEKYGVEYKKSQNSTNSYGKLSKDKFMSFLKEFDQVFDLSTTLIDLESIVINPLYL